MSDIDVVRQAYEAWNSGEPFDRSWTPDAVFMTSGLFPGMKAVYRGPEGMEEFFRTMMEAWESFSIDAEEISEEGNLIVDALGALWP